jgi:hypothetical protein
MILPNHLSVIVKKCSEEYTAAGSGIWRRFSEVPSRSSCRRAVAAVVLPHGKS